MWSDPRIQLIFLLFLRAWAAQVYAAFDQSGTLVGYLCSSDVGSDGRQTILELQTEHPEAASAVIAAWLTLHKNVQELKVWMTAAEVETVRHLSSWSEGFRSGLAEHANMYRIFNWQKVVHAFLQLRYKLASQGALPEGCVTLRIPRGPTLCLQIVAGEASCICVDSDADADVVADEKIAMRLLFGPQSVEVMHGACELMRPQGLRLLMAWCPLPLSYSPQDAV